MEPMRPVDMDLPHSIEYAASLADTRQRFQEDSHRDEQSSPRFRPRSAYVVQISLALAVVISIMILRSPTWRSPLAGATILDTVRVEGGGTWTFTSEGTVIPGDGAPVHGSLRDIRLNAPIIAAVQFGRGGYIMIGRDGGVFRFGETPIVEPYLPLLEEYSQGVRWITEATGDGHTIVLVSNLGEHYVLG